MITEIDFFRPLESVDSLLIAMRRAVTPTAYRALQVSLAQELSNAIEQYRGAYDIWQQSLPLNVTAQELKDWRKKFNGIDEWSLHFQSLSVLKSLLPMDNNIEIDSEREEKKCAALLPL